jgi:PhnB protein
MERNRQPKKFMSMKPIPDGYGSITPYLMIQGAARAIEFYKNVFGAIERMRLPTPEGKIAHAEMEIGDSVIMLADECLERGAKSPDTIGGTPVCLHLYVADADAVFAKAIATGAEQIRPVADQFYGDRSGMFSDPFGHTWNVATHVEDVSPEELQKRMAAMIE